MTEKLDGANDLVSVAELDPVSRAYCRRSEVELGKVSRRLVEERRRATEGRALAALRSRGESVGVREHLDRDGQPRLSTTSIASTVDLVGERAR